MQGRDIGLRLSKLLRYHVAYGPLSPDVLLRAPPDAVEKAAENAARMSRRPFLPGCPGAAVGRVRKTAKNLYCRRGLSSVTQDAQPVSGNDGGTARADKRT